MTATTLRCAAGLAATFLFVQVQSTPAFGQARVVITEIMYNPNSNEKDEESEWVEIANIGSETAEIKDWRLDDEDKGDWGRFSCTLAPGGVAVLVNSRFVKEEQFRAAWDPAPPSSPADPAAAAPLAAYQVIPVTWANLANTPSADNEHLRLLNDKGETVCEVKQAGGWPQVGKPDGSSIYLADIQAANLNDGKVWKRSEKGVDLARTNTKTDVFGGVDIGSPGVVPGLNGAVASAPPPANKTPPPAETAPAATKPANKIDY